MTEASEAAWHAADAPLELFVGCGGARHVIRWERGRLELVDHPELDSELVLVALGGDEPDCLSLFHLWNDAVADGGFLAEWVDETRLTPAWFSWLAMALDRMRAEGFHEFLRRLPPARAQRMGEFLHRFPPAWLDRAAAVVNEAVIEGDGVACSLAPSQLVSATGNRLRKAFVDSVGGRRLAVGAAALVPLDLSVESLGDRSPTAEGVLTGPGRGVRLSVDRTWLHRVWAPGAAVVDGDLVLGLLAVEPSQAGVLTARTHELEPLDATPQSDGMERSAGSTESFTTTDRLDGTAFALRWRSSRDGPDIPEVVRRAVRFDQRRWTWAPLADEVS